MSAVGKAVIALAAGGLLLTLCETALPRSDLKRTAAAAIGLLFLELLAGQIAGILQ